MFNQKNQRTTAKNRLSLLQSQLLSNKCLNSRKYTPASDNDVVIVSCCRTALGKAKKGSFKDSFPEILISSILKELLKRGNVKPEQVQEIILGSCLLKGSGAVVTRVSQVLANIPIETPYMTTNTLAGSGLQAVINISNAIIARDIDIGIAIGCDMMSIDDMHSFLAQTILSEEALENEKILNGSIPMAFTAENIAEKFQITRFEQDKFAYESHKKSAIAQKNGWFNDEIVPIQTKIKDKSGNLKDIIVNQDECIRPETTMETLGKLKVITKEEGTITAGNSCQESDGAGGVLLASRSFAKKHGLPIVGRILGSTLIGVQPEIMGIGPSVAIPKVLEKTGLKLEDIDIFEINEAFAAQILYCINKLNLPMEKVNPRGGSIALGHPIGATGARLFSTLLSELKRTGKKIGLISQCIGGGMGIACVVERE